MIYNPGGFKMVLTLQTIISSQSYTSTFSRISKVGPSNLSTSPPPPGAQGIDITDIATLTWRCTQCLARAGNIINMESYRDATIET